MRAPIRICQTIVGFSKGWIVRNDFQRERGNLYVQIGFYAHSQIDTRFAMK